jgi:DNA-binding transcriptional LysR family regulator
MELRHLRYFVAAADAGSITRAAVVVRVAQPSLSRQLRQLEQEVGEQLLDRSGRQARLTAAGEVFLPLARDLVGRADRAVALMHGLAAPGRVTLRMAAPETTVADVIAPFLATLPEAAPMIDVREAVPAHVHAQVLAGAADLGVSSVPPPRELASRLLVHFPIWAYMRHQHRWARRRTVTIRELASEPLLVLGTGHGSRRQLDAAMSDAGVSYGVAAETNVPEVAQALAAAGRGVAVVSDDARYGLRRVRIRPAGGPVELQVPLFGAWDGSHYAAAVIADLVEGLARFAQERYGLPDHERPRGLASRFATGSKTMPSTTATMSGMAKPETSEKPV